MNIIGVDVHTDKELPVMWLYGNGDFLGGLEF